LDASLPLRYFTDFAASAKSWAELLPLFVTVQFSASCYRHQSMQNRFIGAEAACRGLMHLCRSLFHELCSHELLLLFT
ncbi:MAG: hypothetical protein K2P44_09400, partial [Lachnospiraceae bacterium]|nr:hypothetical protein [Lachnospiraceae bacterium]